MKIFNTIRKAVRRAILPVALVVGAGSACAQTSIPLKIYPLTNSLAGTNQIAMTNGATKIAPGAQYTVTSQPFQIWRGRGFSFNWALYGTNATVPSKQATLTAGIRQGNIHAIPGTSTLVTNWTTTNITAQAVVTDTNEQFFSVNVPASTADNVSLGQLLTLSNSDTTNSLWFDPTNSYIGVYP
ncbi:MAG TPA: hypothetical protein VG347_03545 [Verrucomicrobiae bacterium]|nr:hypothetical protein [Verrucomicrobiae bacterium]